MKPQGIRDRTGDDCQSSMRLIRRDHSGSADSAIRRTNRRECFTIRPPTRNTNSTNRRISRAIAPHWVICETE